MQRAFFGLVALTQLTGCAAYRIVPTNDFKARAPMIQEYLRANPEEAMSIVKLNEFPNGAHCFEPLLYVLSLGIIPTHCVDQYHVKVASTAQSEEKDLTTDYEVTAMQGWIVLFLPLSPRWKFGFEYNADEEIRRQISAD